MARRLSKISEQLRELGFGNRTFEEADRLINKDGSYNVRRKGIGISGFSTYHAVINMPWVYFFIFVTIAYFLLNVFFGSLYYLIGVENLSGMPHDTRWDEFVFCFYFSTQTLTTVGYGRISPTGNLTNLVAAFEAMIGLLSFALATGILYGRFSKAKAKLLFSQYALVAPYEDGTTGLKIRVANQRKNQLIDLSAKVIYSYLENQNDGEEKRRYRQLDLEIDFINMFPLPWTLVHPINKQSPIFEKKGLDLSGEGAEFIVIIKGYDDTFNQYVHQVNSYKHDEVMFDADFDPVFKAEKGYTEVFLNKVGDFHKVS